MCVSMCVFYFRAPQLQLNCRECPLEQLLKIVTYHVSMMLECNLKLVGRVFSLANASKSTHKSTHGTRLCGVAQGLHIAIVLSVCGLE